MHGTLIIDAGGVIRYCSTALAHRLRRRAEELLGAAIASVLPDYALPLAQVESQADCGRETLPINLHLASADGSRIPVSVRVCTLTCDPSSLLVLDVWTTGGSVEDQPELQRESTDTIRAMERLTHAATHDNLTALPNRQLFFDRLGQALRHAARRASGLAVAVVDVDRFKEINDALGHLAGDAVLKVVASRLARSVREADIVARLGGDEFGLVLLDVAEPGTLAPVLAKIERVFERPVLVDERPIPVSISMGACLYPAAGGSEHELIQCAEKVMVQAKRSGGGRYFIGRARDAARP